MAHRDETELDLVRLAKDGDDSAFAALAEQYRDRVFRTASRFARGRHELEDLAQEVFIRVWRGLQTFREDSPFENWFMRVTVHTCYDFLRKHRRRRESEVLVDETPAAQPENISGNSHDDSIRRRRDAWELVASLLDELPEKDRLVITLIDLERHSVKETAALTGWSESNVKVRAFRARKKMRDAWEKRQQPPRDSEN